MGGSGPVARARGGPRRVRDGSCASRAPDPLACAAAVRVRAPQGCGVASAWAAVVSVRAPQGWGGPKRVWVSLFSEDSARGWSKMRLSLTVLAGFRRFWADSDAFWTRRPDRPRIRPRLRRISDHQAAGRSGCWGTNSLFRKAPSPPGSRGVWAITKRCGSAARPLPTGLLGRLGGRQCALSAWRHSAGLCIRVWQEDRAG